MTPTTIRSTRRTVVTGALVLVLVAAALRVSLALPEPCPSVDGPTVSAAAQDTVDWFARNLHDDGRWTYLYRPGADDPLPDEYNLVRHAGVTMSLYQGARADLTGSLAVADTGAAFALDHLVEAGGGRAFARPGAEVRVGASALLAAGLVERRESTGDDRHDDVMRDLGVFLAGQVEPDGRVLAAWDPATGAPVPDEVSVFFTGEVAWALARLHEAFPTAGFDDPAGRTAVYLRTRDQREGRFPPTPDHWGAYMVESLVAADALPDDAVEVGPRLARVLGSQARFQAKAFTGLGRELSIGGEVRAAGAGTTGEGLGALWRAAEDLPALAPLRPRIAERVVCTAGRLVASQVDAVAAAGDPLPDIARGAWFAAGETRMDDQQHALSALLAARTILGAGAPS